MKCGDCPFYASSLNWNRCSITDSEYFYTQQDCDLVNDDGTENKENYKKHFESEVTK